MYQKSLFRFPDKNTSKEMDHSSHIDHIGDRVNDYNWSNYLADTLKFQHLFELLLYLISFINTNNYLLLLHYEQWLQPFQ